jgi:hypothetical protein
MALIFMFSCELYTAPVCPFNQLNKKSKAYLNNLLDCGGYLRLQGEDNLGDEVRRRKGGGQRGLAAL